MITKIITITSHIFPPLCRHHKTVLASNQPSSQFKFNKPLFVPLYDSSYVDFFHYKALPLGFYFSFLVLVHVHHYCEGFSCRLFLFHFRSS